MVSRRSQVEANIIDYNGLLPMGHGMRLDYGTYAKRGFTLGVALLVIGVVGSAIGPSVAGPLPDWERTVLFDFMWMGILIGFFSVFGFGIFLPLTD